MFKEKFFVILALLVTVEYLTFFYLHESYVIEKELEEFVGLSYQVSTMNDYLEILERKAERMGVRQ